MYLGQGRRCLCLSPCMKTAFCGHLVQGEHILCARAPRGYHLLEGAINRYLKRGEGARVSIFLRALHRPSIPLEGPPTIQALHGCPWALQSCRAFVELAFLYVAHFLFLYIHLRYRRYT